MEQNRGSDSNLPVLAERDWRFSEEVTGTIPLSPKIQASDWCNKGVVIVYYCLHWDQPIRGLDFWGFRGITDLLSH